MRKPCQFGHQSCQSKPRELEVSPVVSELDADEAAIVELSADDLMSEQRAEVTAAKCTLL